MSMEMAEYVADDGEIVKFPLRLAAVPFFDDSLMQAMMTERIFSAKTLDDAMSPTPEAESFNDYADQQLVIHGAGLRPSNIDGKRGIYAIIDVEVVKEQARKVFTTGATQPLAVIARAYSEEKLPLACKVMIAVPQVKGQNGQIFLLTPEAF